MPPSIKTTSDDYYDKSPVTEHRAGDVWENLPTHGILPTHGSKFLVITPACDLANRKVSAICYLPIVSVAQYFSSLLFYPQIIAEIVRMLLFVGMESEFEIRYPMSPPPLLELEGLEEKIRTAATQSNLDTKKKTGYERILGGIKCLKSLGASPEWTSYFKDLKLLLGEKPMKTNIERMISNSFSSDLHFLPSDGQKKEWSGVYGHSVVLFRYPLSCPLEILDRAQDMTIHDWNAEKRKLQTTYPVAASFTDRPMKKATVRPRFYADLFTRYLAMYLRLGSPDFTQESMETFANEIGEGT
jgi:hypothetical protein